MSDYRFVSLCIFAARRAFSPLVFNLLLAICAGYAGDAAAQTVIRIAASNCTSGFDQDYQLPGQRILKALKPDITLIQEFNVPGTNDTAAVNSFVQSNFGTGFAWVREPVASSSIPNGIISRWPITAWGE